MQILWARKSQLWTHADVLVVSVSKVKMWKSRIQDAVDLSLIRQTSKLDPNREFSRPNSGSVPTVMIQIPLLTSFKNFGLLY